VRIERLLLHAYGPFTGRTLDFTAPGLHLVVGPNEAGKSSALHAIVDALFGIPIQTGAGFVHDMRQLEIGLELRDGRGSTLAFRRLKKAKDDLRRVDDTVLAPVELAAFLGPIDRTVFEKMYGIDHTELVEGGADLIAGKGELGQALFGAGSGVRHLHALLSGLDDQAGALFKPTGAQPKLNQALTRHTAASRSAREHALRPAVHDELLEQRDALEARSAGLSDEHIELTRRRELCQMLIAVLPTLRQRRDACRTIASLQPVTRRLREDIGAELEALLEARAVTHREVLRLEGDIDALEGRIAAIQIDGTLLARRGDIGRLRDDRNRFISAREDRPGVSVACDAARRAAESLVARLRPGLRLDEARTDLVVATTTAARIEKLAGEAVELALRARDTAHDLTATRAALATALAELDAHPAPPDDQLLQAVLASALAAGNLAGQLDAVRDQRRVLESTTAVGLDELGLAATTSESLHELPVPSQADLESHRSALEANATAIARSEERLDDLHDQLARAGAERDELLAATDAPSQDELSGRRTERDELWSRVRGRWLGTGPAHDDPSATGPTDDDPTELADHYERTVRHTDDLADRLRREADAVAGRAHLEATLASLEGRITGEVAELEDRRAEATVLAARWAALWSPVGVTPASPAEMTTWLGRLRDLRSEAHHIRRLAEQTEALEQAVEHHRTELRAGLASVGLACGDDLGLPTLAERARQTADELAERRVRRQDLDKEVTRLAVQERQDELAQHVAHDALATWQQAWDDAVQLLGLPAGTPVEEAEAYVRDAATLATRLEELGDRHDRLVAIDDFLDSYADELAELLGHSAPDLVGRDPLSALDTLITRLDEAVEADSRVRTLSHERDSLDEQRADAHRSLHDADQTLARLQDEAGVSSEPELREAIARSDQLREAEDALRALDQLISSQSQGRGATVLEGALAERDEVELHAAVVDLDERLLALADQLQECNTELGATRTRLGALDGSAAAADAAHDAQLALSEIAELTEEYLGVRLATELLRDQMAAYRDAHQGPILRRAAPWFARLTCGHFAGLDTSIDDRGEVVLEGIRPNGERVLVAGMSEGTCDQLYLALRLAALVETAGDQEPFPLVLDDVFMTFDDDRARAALEILGELSETFQVLVFSHHRHLRELAREALDDRLTVHDLEPRDPSGPLVTPTHRRDVAPPGPARRAATGVADATGAILDALRSTDRPLGKAALLERTGVPPAAWPAAIRELLEAGLVAQEGVKRGAVYRLAAS
jgi:uncharacterized protein YhaN